MISIVYIYIENYILMLFQFASANSVLVMPSANPYNDILTILKCAGHGI